MKNDKDCVITSEMLDKNYFKIWRKLDDCVTINFKKEQIESSYFLKGNKLACSAN